MKVVRGYRNAYGPSRPFTGRFGAVSSDASSSDPSPAILTDDDPSDPGDDLPPNGGGNGGDGSNIPPEYLGDPIFLSADVTLNSNQSIATPNQEALRNPYPSVIEICEIRFMLTTALVGVISHNPFNSPAGNVGVTLSLDDAQLTQAANGIPINLLCPGQQLNAESIAYGSLEWGTTNPAAFVGSYRLVLKTPLLVLPNELLSVELSSLSVLTSSIDVRVSYLGRVRPDLAVPTKRVIPFFSVYSSPALSQPSTSTVVNSFISSETDLQNVFEDAIRVHRFVGRCNAFFYAAPSNTTAAQLPSSAGPFTEFTDSAVSGQTSNTATLIPGSDKVFIGMLKSTGTPTIAPGTPFRLAFDAFTRSWETDDVVPAHGYYIATVSVEAPDEGIDLAPAPIYLGIAMHAERLVEIVAEAEAA